MRDKEILCACWALLVVCGCDNSASGQVGELGNGTFHYLCESVSDAQCDDNALKGDLDESTGAFPPIAVEGRFQLSFVSNDGLGAGYITPGSRAFVDFEGESTFFGVAPGVVAVMATDSNAGRAHDLIHIRVADVEGVRVSQTTTTTEAGGLIAAGTEFNIGGAEVDVELAGGVLAVSEQTYLRAAPVDASDNILAGALAVQWESSDPGIVAIVSDATNNVIEIEPMASGSATLTVTMGTTTRSVDIDAAGGS